MSPSLNDLFAEITRMMATHGPMFEAAGLWMFRGISLILVISYAAYWGLNGSFPGAGNIAKFALQIVICGALLSYYTSPIPYFGESFTGLVTNNSLWVSNQLSGQLASDLMGRLNDLYFTMEDPGLSAVINAVVLVRWIITVVCLAVAQIAIFAVISFGYIATAVCILVGPLFLPWMLVPGFEWIFWGFFRAFLQYSSYSYIAAAFLLCAGGLLLNYVDRVGAGGLTNPNLGLHFMNLVIMLMGFVWTITKIPSLTNSIWSGKSGEGISWN